MNLPSHTLILLSKTIINCEARGFNQLLPSELKYYHTAEQNNRHSEYISVQQFIVVKGSSLSVRFFYISYLCIDVANNALAEEDHGKDYFTS